MVALSMRLRLSPQSRIDRKTVGGKPQSPISVYEKDEDSTMKSMSDNDARALMLAVNSARAQDPELCRPDRPDDAERRLDRDGEVRVL